MKRIRLKNTSEHTGNRIIYTLVATMLICTVFLSIITYLYKRAEDSCFETLHIHTAQIKENINLQMLSDRENLAAMASFAAKLYEDGESFAILFESFEEMGLIENVGILMPDNRFITKRGILNLAGEISFEEEARKGKHITGRVSDMTNPQREVLRSAVPIISGGKTVAMLYGLVEPQKLERKYVPFAQAYDAQLYIVDSKNGDFILDTLHEDLGNIMSFGNKKQKEGYSYQKMYEDILAGEDGYTAFVSEVTGENMYAHYAPMEIEDWQILLCQPENIVFAEAREVGEILFVGFILVIAIMIMYILLTYSRQRKRAKIVACASKVRKLLLEVSRRFSSIRETLQTITSFVKARSAVFFDSDGEDFNYIAPEFESRLLTKGDRKYFMEQLVEYARDRRSKEAVDILIITIRANSALKKENPCFYEFLNTHMIKRIVFAVLADKGNHLSILGVLNPMRAEHAKELLKDVGVCFAMAIYNKKYLSRTEHMAVTDSLTGLLNHMAYMHDRRSFNKIRETLVCVYIDVNELHYINNKFGHSEGDKMLVFIADTLNAEFPDAHVYRIGGDEFVVFAENCESDAVEDKMKWVKSRIEEHGYHISVGIEKGKENTDIEELVKTAEAKMYREKAQYYQQREFREIPDMPTDEVKHIKTGVKEIDDCMSIMHLRYSGICSVSLKNDTAKGILSLTYLENALSREQKFSASFEKYVHEIVHPDYQRLLTNLLEYDALISLLENGHSPSVTYKKIDGGKSVVSIYAVPNQNEINDTIWVFEKINE